MKINQLTPDTRILKELGNRLALARKLQGFNQEQLAKAAGLGVDTLRRIETGQDSQLGSWLKLFKALQMSELIDNMLPEKVDSPMAERLGKKKKLKAAEPNLRYQWGDEKQ